MGILTLTAGSLHGQPAGFNYDESQVPSYELPEILRLADGTIVENADRWDRRRSEILRQFEEQVYGKAPGRPAAMRFTVVEEEEAALGGMARRKQVRVDFTRAADGPGMVILLYTPRSRTWSGCCLCGAEFQGQPHCTSRPRDPHGDQLGP